MEDTYGFSLRFCWTPRNARSSMVAFEGVVRNHLARLSQQQERDFYSRQRIEQSALFRLQSQHKHLKVAEQKACVSFCAHSIFVTLHPLLYKVRLFRRVCLCRKQKFKKWYWGIQVIFILRNLFHVLWNWIIMHDNLESMEYAVPL